MERQELIIKFNNLEPMKEKYYPAERLDFLLDNYLELGFKTLELIGVRGSAKTIQIKRKVLDIWNREEGHYVLWLLANTDEISDFTVDEWIGDIEKIGLLPQGFDREELIKVGRKLFYKGKLAMKIDTIGHAGIIKKGRNENMKLMIMDEFNQLSSTAKKAFSKNITLLTGTFWRQAPMVIISNTDTAAITTYHAKNGVRLLEDGIHKYNDFVIDYLSLSEEQADERWADEPDAEYWTMVRDRDWRASYLGELVMDNTTGVVERWDYYMPEVLDYIREIIYIPEIDGYLLMFTYANKELNYPSQHFTYKTAEEYNKIFDKIDADATKKIKVLKQSHREHDLVYDKILKDSLTLALQEGLFTYETIFAKSLLTSLLT